LAFTEPGALFDGDSLYVSLVCADWTSTSVVLVRSGTGGRWEHLGTVMDRDDAQAILNAAMGLAAPDVGGVSASELTRVEGEPTLIVSPVLGDYRGCWFFGLDLQEPAILPTVLGTPTVVVENTPDSILSGVCAFHEAATETGILFGEATFNAPQFRLFATGRFP
ncbi:MAG: hypothetical protein AAF658_20420, partial [Myxococcota bacterium]